MAKKATPVPPGKSDKNIIHLPRPKSRRRDPIVNRHTPVIENKRIYSRKNQGDSHE
ncbi:hypothetical protein KKG19_00240 [Patescibacteria group bacterium]|nr:hypothetical protein [Patescibacteria group bacterium]